MRFLIWTFVLLLSVLTVSADESDDPVGGMVTAFVKNISKLAQWPGEKVVTTKDRPLFVAVVGKTALAKNLKTLNRTETPDGYKLTVRRVDLDLLPANAHAVVLCVSDTTVAKRVVKKLAGTNTFTIGIGPHKVGALLHCQIDPVDSSKVISEVSQAIADAEQIKIQKPLTMLAKVVD